MSKIGTTEDGKFVFHCPGCGYGHFFDSRWTWNNDFENPTVTPSILVSGVEPRCHLYIKDGTIQFLDDCTHTLKGRTVPIPDFQ